MATPALSIPIRANLDDFKSKMNETGAVARNATKAILGEFVKMNAEIGGPIAASMAANAGRSILSLVGKFALVVGAAKLVGDAIGETRDQLQQMITVADKASNLNVSPAFLQGFLSASKGLKVSVEDLEGALSHAFNATKDRSPIDLSEWDFGKEKITDVEKALRVYNETFAKTAGMQLQGLTLFRDADTQEKKIRAVLLAMVQLDEIGQHTAALDLGEKMFGSQFVDRIRQGKTSAESMLATMQAAAAADSGIFSNEMVNRAKAVDEQLKLAQNRLTDSLKPAWNDIATTILTIKTIWTDVVDLIGKAVDATNKLGLTSERARIKSELSGVNDAIKNGTNLLGGPQVPEAVTNFLGMKSPQQRLRERQQLLQGQLDQMDSDGTPFGPELPKPSRGTGAAPKPRATDTETGRDRFEASADNIEKRTAALQAETETIGQNAAARDKAKITAQLMATATQMNAEAGKGENVVTAEQKARIEEVAAAYEKAAASLEKMKVGKEIAFDRNTAFLSSDDVAIAQKLRGLYGDDVPTALASTEAAAMRANNAFKTISSSIESNLTNGLMDVMNGTKSVKDAFKSMAASILQDLQRMLIKAMIVGPLMKALSGGLSGGLFSGGGFVGSSGGTGLSLTATGGLYDSGGYTGSGGKYEPAGIVHRGEYVMDAATTSRIGVRNLDRLRGYADGGFVTPPSLAAVASPSISPSAGGGGMHVTVGVTVDNEGNLKAYVKDIAQQTASAGIRSFAGSNDFKHGVYGAVKQGRNQRHI